MLYILKCIHVCIIAVYIGGAGQIFLKTVHKHFVKICSNFEQLFRLTVLIHLIICSLQAFTFLPALWKYYSSEKIIKKK